MNWISIFSHLSYILTLCAYLVKDMLKLRLLAIAAAVFSIVYAFFFTSAVLWDIVFWEVASIIINAVHVVLLLRERGSIRFTGEETALYQGVFRGMPRHDFRRLLDIGSWRDFAPGVDLITEGVHVDTVSVITSGTAEIRSGDRIVAYCSRGALLGEMSYITGEPASATVRAGENVRCYVWEQSVLHALEGKNESVKQGFQTALNENFIRKLQKHKQTDTVLNPTKTKKNAPKRIERRHNDR